MSSVEDPEFLDFLREQARADRDAAAGFATSPVGRYDDDWDLDLAVPPCPDVDVDGRPVGASSRMVVDAQLVLGRRDRGGRLRQSGLRRVHVTSGRDLVALRESTGWCSPLRESASWQEKLREWDWSPDPFAYGNPPVPGVGAGSLGEYAPLWPGPVTRQLYWQDYFGMSAKAFEAYNHDPISWRAIHLKQEYVLGGGMQSRVTFSGGAKAGQTHDAATQVWEEFWKRNRMDNRLDMFCRDLSWGGEQFLRYFRSGRLLTVRALDPASIYDLITDPEDLETVFAYHQQFQAPYQLYPPNAATPPSGVQAPEGPTQPGAATKYIIRQILPQEVDHYRINISAFERRGRSDLFPGLSWIKRLRDYLTSHVIRADMLSRICWDLTVQGNQGTVQQLMGLLFPGGQPPQPGGVFAHNKASELQMMIPQGGATAGGRYDPVLLALVTMVGNSVGVPADWLGFSQATTRANALVATEPAAHSLEELQGTTEQVVHDAFERVMTAAGITDAQLEVTFPSIASEDSSQKLQDLSFAEANQWISKQSAASIAAKELNITTYDFEQEQSLIANEFKDAKDTADSSDGVIRQPMIVATNRQAPKLDPTRSLGSVEDEPPGLLVPFGSGGAEVAQAATAASGAAAQTQVPGGPAQQNTPGSVPSRGAATAADNPLSAAGARAIRSDSLGESRLFTEAEVLGLLREARGPRVRPDDPRFRAAAQEFAAASTANFRQLVDEARAASVREAEVLRAELRAAELRDVERLRESLREATAAADRQEDRRERRGLFRALGRSGERVAEALRDRPADPPPEVSVNVQPAAAPQVTVAPENHVHVPEGAAPVVNVTPENHVHVPEAPAPVVEVAGAQVEVHVPEAPAPQVDVHLPEQRPRRILYDADGNPTGIE